MTKAKLLKLKIGDIVTLAVSCRVYGFAGYVPKGTVGVVTAVKVPSVKRDGVYFVCVDFPPDTFLISKSFVENPHLNKYRVGALPEELV